jgi:antitoxin component HigA of HigAB toxin-antitoxin module
MGRIVELCGEVAAEAEEGPEGLVLSPEAWERLRGDWQDQDIEDALALVQDSLMQSELIESADTLSARLLDLLGAFGETAAFRKAASGQAVMSLEDISQLARRVARLEEILGSYREGTPPDRKGFDALRRRLADHGIEEDMERDADAQPIVPDDEDEDE